MGLAHSRSSPAVAVMCTAACESGGMAFALVSILESRRSRPARAGDAATCFLSKQTFASTPTQPGALSSSAAFVSMVQPAHFGTRDDGASVRSLHWSRLGCILLEPEMRSAPVISRPRRIPGGCAGSVR